MNKWTPPWNSRAIPHVSIRFSLSMEMSRLTRDGTAEPVSRDQILRRERGQGNTIFPCSADPSRIGNLRAILNENDNFERNSRISRFPVCI